MSTEPENSPSPTPPADPPSLVNQTPPATPETPSAETPKVEGEAPKAETPAAPEPITWDTIKLPENFVVEDADRDAVLGIMNDDKLSGTERLQKLVDMQAGLAQRGAEAQLKQWNDLQQTWQDTVRADPDIGGDKLEPTLGAISKLVDKYGSPELRPALDATGAGNHPAVVKFLANVAKDLGEGQPVLGAAPTSKESLADRMYPSMKKQGA